MSNARDNRYKVNLCYCDESGTGEEPIAVMTGIVVDASRMHLTKLHWAALLDLLSKQTGHQIVELHTRHFYSGNDVFRGMDGNIRAGMIDLIFRWLIERKHHVVYASVLKSAYRQAFIAGDIPDELNTIWRFLGFHLVLAMQKYSQQEKGVKGHTLFIFDNEERERMRFTDIIKQPQAWSDTYYNRKKKQSRLDQIMDVPYFGDSIEVALIQLADFTSFFLRRYAEIKDQLVGPRYAEEETRIDGWIKLLMDRSIGANYIYPRRREYAQELFYRMAPPSIRDLRP